MDTLVTLIPLAVALIPIGMALRALLAELRPQTESPTAEFYRANSRPTTYPSLATLRDLEDTMPAFVKRGEWRVDAAEQGLAPPPGHQEQSEALERHSP